MLTLTDLSKTFNPGTVNEKKALQKVNLHLAPGDFATIVGSNGAGKSTLFAAIAGSFYPDEGSVELDGQDVTFLPEHKRSRQLGRLFQDPLRGTAPHMTIEENLSLAYLRASRAKGGILSRVTKAQRELFLLMATLVTPKLLLLDEHTAALDPGTAAVVLDLTEKIVAENHITCLMITHNMPDALRLGNRTLMMDSGRIVLDVQGEERAGMTVADLLERFGRSTGRAMDNDRILLSGLE